MIPRVGGAAPLSLGGYEVLHQLDAGGMGEVLLARKVAEGGFERLVAIKTIRAELRARPELRAMFLDEARLLSHLSHPCIAQVYDFGEADGALYLAMEYVAGVRFTELAQRELAPAIAARAMAQVCRGLHAAHEVADRDGRSLGVVHRDVTPENLILTYEGRVKVLDFGIALMRGRSAPVTEYGTIKGKPPYLSPEQIKNEALDRRTDVFSCGVVLHELLTGETVYQGDSVYAIARAIETLEVNPPSASAGVLPDGLDEVVMTAMQRDPDARFQNAIAMAEALERVASGASAESLDAYAARALVGDRDQHRAWLREILEPTGAAETERIGRASGVLTAQSNDPRRTPRAIEVQASEPIAKPRAAPGSHDEPRAPSSRRAWLLAAAAMLAVGAVALFSVRSCDTRATPMASTNLDAAPVVSTVALPDASSPDAAPATAALPIDAAVRTAVAVRAPRPRPTPRPDAAVAATVPTPTPTPKPTPPVKAEPAFVTIAADPFALVRIDGTEVGTTPIFRRRIPAGRHEIVLISPDSGTVRLRKIIDLAPNAHQEIIAR